MKERLVRRNDLVGFLDSLASVFEGRSHQMAPGLTTNLAWCSVGYVTTSFFSFVLMACGLGFLTGIFWLLSLGCFLAAIGVIKAETKQ